MDFHGFSHEKWWFSTATLIHQTKSWNLNFLYQRVSIMTKSARDTAKIYIKIPRRSSWLHSIKTGLGKCPNWTSPKHWGYNLQQILESDVQSLRNEMGHLPNPARRWSFPAAQSIACATASLNEFQPLRLAMYKMQRAAGTGAASCHPCRCAKRLCCCNQWKSSEMSMKQKIRYTKIELVLNLPDQLHINSHFWWI